jgi:hypothetical protein
MGRVLRCSEANVFHKTRVKWRRSAKGLLPEMKPSCNNIRFFRSYKCLFTVCVLFVPLLPGSRGGRLACAQANSSAPSQLAFDAPPQNPDAIIIEKPYEANRTLHTTRFLADGTVASHDITIREARDSSGRHLEEMQARKVVRRSSSLPFC